MRLLDGGIFCGDASVPAISRLHAKLELSKYKCYMWNNPQCTSFHVCMGWFYLAAGDPGPIVQLHQGILPWGGAGWPSPQLAPPHVDGRHGKERHNRRGKRLCMPCPMDDRHCIRSAGVMPWEQGEGQGNRQCAEHCKWCMQDVQDGVRMLCSCPWGMGVAVPVCPPLRAPSEVTRWLCRWSGSRRSLAGLAASSRPWRRF